MKQYIDILNQVLDAGMAKQPVRFDSHVESKDGKPIKVEQPTIGLPNVIFEHDMQDGFPLLTTKRVAWKAIRVELEGFIRGVTSKKWFQDRGCKIWDQWCNPTAIPEDIKADRDRVHEFMLNHDDLGPVYGKQWRDFGGSGYDQLQVIADRLVENPHDRRMVCSAWAPHQIKEMALPPCHLIWNVVVYGDTISLWWGQRSCDLMLGVPFNIASYALLLELLARHSGLKPWKLTGVLADCHIYGNQVEAAKLQAQRTPDELPSLVFNSVNASKSIFDWDHLDATVEGYHPQKAIDFGKVAVT